MWVPVSNQQYKRKNKTKPKQKEQWKPFLSITPCLYSGSLSKFLEKFWTISPCQPIRLKTLIFFLVNFPDSRNMLPKTCLARDSFSSVSDDAARGWHLLMANLNLLEGPREFKRSSCCVQPSRDDFPRPWLSLSQTAYSWMIFCLRSPALHKLHSLQEELSQYLLKN